jgi:hypothetical protein
MYIGGMAHLVAAGVEVQAERDRHGRSQLETAG